MHTTETADGPATERPGLGLVTIGQSPRTDLLDDVLPLLGEVRPIEHGALDEDEFEGAAGQRTRELIAPEPGEAPLISRLRGGGSVVLGHRALASRIGAAVARCEAAGAGATLLLCTGNFPSVPAERPLLYAEALVQRGVQALVGSDPVGVVCPLPEQREDVRRRWSAVLPGAVSVRDADPYAPGAPQAAARAGELLAADGARWVVLDCIGYSDEMRRAALASASVPVLLARALATRLAVEAAG